MTDNTYECALPVQDPAEEIYYELTLDQENNAPDYLSLSEVETCVENGVPIYTMASLQQQQVRDAIRSRVVSKRLIIVTVLVVFFLTVCAIVVPVSIALWRQGENLSQTTQSYITTTKNPFICSLVSTEYIPYSDTYPNKCNTFQWCVNGISYQKTCQGVGYEFTYEKPGDVTCAEPSNSTYCGKLRQLDTAHEATTTVTTISSSTQPSSTTIITNTTDFRIQSESATPLTNISSVSSLSPRTQTSTATTTNTFSLTTPIISSTTEASTVAMYTTVSPTSKPTTTIIRPILVNFIINDVAVIGESFTFHCIVSNAQSVYEIEFSREGETLAVLNTSNSLATVTQSSLSVKGKYDSDNYKAEVTLNPVACSDFGNYECVTKGNNSVSRQAAVLQVRRHPDALPTLEVPPSVEGVTLDSPICRATSMGYSPVMAFTWVLKRLHGNEERVSQVLKTDVITSNTTSCTSSGNSTLNAQRYTGWNNTDLCCQLTDPNNSSLVVMEVCQTIQTLPADFCSSGNRSYLTYPYEPCYTFVQCLGASIYFGLCPKQGPYCFDVTSVSCSLSPSTSSTTQDPSRTTQSTIITTRNPFICSMGGPEYIPYNDTYPNKCSTFQWCVNFMPITQTCTGVGQEFTYEKPGDSTCAEPSDITYCGKLRQHYSTRDAQTSTATLSNESTTSTTIMTKTTLPPNVVNLTVNDVAVIGESFTFQCTVRNVQSLYEIEISRDGQTLAVLNTSSSLVIVTQPSVSVKGQYDSNTYKSEVTLYPVACSDFGNYECIARGTSSLGRQTAVLQVRRPDLVTPDCKDEDPVEGDYCSTGNSSFLIYPLESCYTYIICVGPTIYFSFCPKELGLCFDVTTVSCSLRPATTSTTYDPSLTTQTTLTTTRNPFICFLGGPEYLPYSDTYPNKCNTFQRCVNGISYLQTCQGQGNEFIYEKPGDSTCAALSNTTYCGKQRLLVTTQPATTSTFFSSIDASTSTFTTLPPIVLNLTVNDVAVVGESFTFQCTVRNVQSLYEIEISRNGQTLAVLNTSSSLVIVTQPSVSVKGKYDSDTYKSEVTLYPVACSDFGNYECIARGTSSLGRQTAVLQVRRLPDSLSLEVPLSVEGVTQSNPVCRATSQGYNPVMAFTWVLKRPNGVEERLSHSLQTDDTKTNTSSCTSNGSSTLNAQRYTGWNNTNLCCQLTDPNNGSLVAKEICQKIQTLPGDYCSTGNSSFLIYPFESCYTYISCAGPTIYFSFCSKALGLCFDITTVSCSLRPATTSTTYDPSRTTQTTITTTRNPFICSLGGPEYLPYSDTYPNKCNTFQWCVNGFPYLQTCQGLGTEFIYEKSGDNSCAAPSNTTYCGKLRLLVTTQPVDPTGTTVSTAAPPTTTQNPFSCTGNSLTYIPTINTYPNRCGEYRWCYGSGEFLQNCTVGSEFAYGPNPCIYREQGDTYCEQREALATAGN